MGYSTDFTGTLTVTPPLNEHERSYLEDFSSTRQTSTSHGQLEVGHNTHTGNTPQGSKPGIWCDWVPDDEGNLEWNEDEKTYFHDQWIQWLITHLFGPDSQDFVQQRLDEDPRLQHFTCDHIVNGIVDAHGEDNDDLWRIKVVDNEVTTQVPRIVYPD